MNTAELLARARLLNRDLAPGDPLAETVIRPLTEAAADAEPEVAEDGTPAERLWELAKDATRLRTRSGAHQGLIEATAALQHLACLFAEDAGSLTKRIAELADIQGDLESRVDVAVRSAQRSTLTRFPTRGANPRSRCPRTARTESPAASRSAVRRRLVRRAARPLRPMDPRRNRAVSQMP